MFDICYYINLDKRTDRRESIERNLKLAKIFDVSHRISAILNSHNGPMGCALSHILTLHYFIESKHETCLIVEDDLIIKDPHNFKKNIAKIYENNIDFDIIQISGKFFEVLNTEYEFLSKVINSQTTSGYILHKNFAKKLLNRYEVSLIEMIDFEGQIGNSIDKRWKVLQPIYKWYAFNPPLGFQGEGYSDIEKDNVNYGI